MTGFLAITIDDEGNVELAPFTAASLAAAKTDVQNAIAAQLTTGLPVNPDTGEPDVRVAVRAAVQEAIQPPTDGVLVLLLQVSAATEVLPGATPAAPVANAWTT